MSLLHRQRLRMCSVCVSSDGGQEKVCPSRVGPRILMAHLSDHQRHKLFQMLCCSVTPGFPVLLCPFTWRCHPCKYFAWMFWDRRLCCYHQSPSDGTTEEMKPSQVYFSEPRESPLWQLLCSARDPSCWPPQVPPRPSIVSILTRGKAGRRDSPGHGPVLSKRETEIT